MAKLPTNVFPQSKLDSSQAATVRELASQFEEATGISCVVLGMDGVSTKLSARCRFCRRAVALKLKKVGNCAATHLYGTYQAERFGGRYIYFCSSSMTHWAVPLMLDGHVVASFVCGPVLQIDPDEYLQDEMPVPNKAQIDQIAEVHSLFREIPFAEASKITALAELLYKAVTGLSSQLSGATPDRTAGTNQSSRIAEYIHELKQRTDANISYPIEKERELLLLISQGDKTNSQKVLNDIIGHIFFSSGNNVSSIRIRVQELIVMLSRGALEGGASVEEIFGLNDAYLLQLQQMNCVDEIAAWLVAILKRFSDCVFNLKSVKHADVIRKAMHFINANLARKIVLQDVADNVYMSASHFSKVFNEEIGLSVTEYLGKLRVEKSKILLRESSNPLSEIATMVGFDDQSYFTKVFKKHTGQSPGRYRSSRGQISKPGIEIHE